ncbi:MAG TPA: YlxR family protein [Acidimicrobiia bacterium]|nr:YlxR family protein [Acidimicrobiia bacterium]
MTGPIRTCVGCRRTGPPARWTRLAASPDGTVGTGRTAPGRGAWVCSPACFDSAVRTKALARALRCEVSSTAVEALRATLLSTNFEK